MECLRHFDGIVPSVASILTKQFLHPWWKIPLENPWKCHFWDSKDSKMSLDASALKNLCLWCKFQSHLLFIISLLLENVLTALSTCLLDSACAKPNDSCKCWSWLSGVGILEWDIENDNYRLYWAISPQSRFHSTTDRLLAIRLSLQYKVLYLTYGK